MTAEGETIYRIVTLNNYPAGFQCGRCGRRLLIGQPFDTVLESMDNDIHNTTTSLLVCVYCVGVLGEEP